MPNDTLEDDVPVYEPIYPEAEAECSHPACSNETPVSRRICEECTPVMLNNAPDECAFCGSSVSVERPDRNT